MSLINYSDDKSLESSSENLVDVLCNLNYYGCNAIEWFEKKWYASQSRWVSCYVLSPTPTEKQVLQLFGGTSVMFDTEVTVLGVTIDEMINFSQRIRVCCKKAARQLNALAHISNHLSIDSRRAIYDSLIKSNLIYRLLTRQFWGKVNNPKLEKTQDRALRILFADYISSYPELLEKAGTTTFLIQQLRLIALPVFKSLHGLNPLCLNDVFTFKFEP